MTAIRGSVPGARAGLLLLLLSGSLLGLLTGPAHAGEAGTATPTPTPTQEPGVAATSVSLLPANPAPDDPHNGTWFLLTLEPGASGRAVAAVTNPTEQPVEVRLFLADLEFREDGTPSLNDDATAGLAAWGRFDEGSVRIAPHATQQVGFQVTVPSGTASRDYIGAAVAETTTTAADGTEVVQRVATRVVATVPGAGDRAFEIASVDIERDSTLWPSQLVVRVELRNTGEIRVEPTVTVAGIAADGPRALVSRSSEAYVATVDVDTLGGYVRLPVVAMEAGGITRRVDRAQTVVPWGWLLVAGLVAAIVITAARTRDRRGRIAALQADVRRLEQLVMRMRGAAETATRPATNGELRVTTEDALRNALRSARRAGEWESFARVALALHQFNADALTPLVEAVEHESSLRPQLIEAIGGYGPEAVEEHPLVDQLPDDVYAAILERVARTSPT